MSLIYAIDFGTTNSLLAAARQGEVVQPIALDPTAADPTVMRSVLYTPSKDKWHFGSAAIQLYSELFAEGRLFRSIKKYLPEASFEGTVIHGKKYSLEDLIAVFLREMRERANRHFDQDVTSVVLGRPAAFSLDRDKDDLAERRLRQSAERAGFKSIEFCPEPIAAAYEFRHSLSAPKTVLIADFGGGTSDFTVLNMGSGPFRRQDVLSIGGVSVAGDRFDGAMMKGIISPHFGAEVQYRLPMGSVNMRIPQHVLNKMCSPADISFLARDDISALLRDAQKWSIHDSDARKMEYLFALVEEHLGYKLFQSIESAKVQLSKIPLVDFLFKHFDIQIQEEISNERFAEVSADVVSQICKSLDETVRQAGLLPNQIEIVCCTGGTAQIPQLRMELAKRFGEEKLKQHRHFHSVITGLAERATELV
jgi:hypothetical chaperone protein